MEAPQYRRKNSYLREWLVSLSFLLVCVIDVAAQGVAAGFTEPTFWEQYKWYVIVVVFGLLLQSGLIAWLLFTRARRRQAETEKERLASIAGDEHRRVNE